MFAGRKLVNIVCFGVLLVARKKVSHSEDESPLDRKRISILYLVIPSARRKYISTVILLTFQKLQNIIQEQK